MKRVSDTTEPPVVVPDIVVGQVVDVDLELALVPVDVRDKERKIVPPAIHATIS